MVFGDIPTVDFGPTVDCVRNVLSCVSLVSPFSYPSLLLLPLIYLEQPSLKQPSATFALYSDGVNIRPTLGPSLCTVSFLFSILKFVLTCCSPHIWECDTVIIPLPLPLPSLLLPLFLSHLLSLMLSSPALAPGPSCSRPSHVLGRDNCVHDVSTACTMCHSCA
jgi:hypothetical protein